MSSGLYLDANFVKAQVARLIEAMPELAEDEDLRLGMIEGETDLLKILDRLVKEELDAEAVAEGLGLRMRDMSTRAGRFMRKAEAMRELIKSLMKAAKQDKITLPEATISISKPRMSVGIENVDDLPQGFFKTERKADKAAIKAAFDAGEQVPGAFKVLGSEGLRISSK